jgi:alpha-L-fucosidase 2
MIFGVPEREQIQLNEETVWAGGPNNNINHDAYPVIQKTRALLLEGRYEEAQELVNSRLTPEGNSGMPYQPVGDLLIAFPGHDRCSNYSRQLDISNATTTTTYVVGDVTFTRTCFASFSDSVIIVRLEASKPGRITCSFTLHSPYASITNFDGDTLVLQASPVITKTSRERYVSRRVSAWPRKEGRRGRGGPRSSERPQQQSTCRSEPTSSGTTMFPAIRTRWQPDG